MTKYKERVKWLRPSKPGTVSFEYFLWDGLGLFTEMKRKAYISFLMVAT